jgi:hypothetical protein
MVDQLSWELHAVLHDSARTWDEIFASARREFWVTGTGEDMFKEDALIWSLMPPIGRSHLAVERDVASLARTDPGDILDRKLCDVLRLPPRPREDRDAYLVSLAAALDQQLRVHGDERLGDPHNLAAAFADQSRRRIEVIEAADGDLLTRMAAVRRIPLELIDTTMTVREFGELAQYAETLSIVQDNMRLASAVTMKDVPPWSLPSYVLSQKLAAIQRRAPRVSGSDLGDSFITPLAFYSDAVVVDKRTAEFLRQLERAESGLEVLKGRYFRESHYSDIPGHFE